MRRGRRLRPPRWERAEGKVDWLTLLILLFLPMTLTFWAIVHVAAIAPFRSTAARLIWLAVVTFLPVVGAAIYLVAGRPRPGPQGSA